MNSINDWSEYLLWAEKNMKDLEHMLLHKDYDLEKMQYKAAAIKQSLDKCLIWVDEERAKQAKR